MSLETDDPRHGTAGGYTNHRCRCSECTDAWRAAHASYMSRNPGQAARHRERQRERHEATRESRKTESAIRARLDARLRRTYNMTLSDYDLMLAAQNGLCALCKRPPRNGKFLHVDHDHGCCDSAISCGACVRGLLCPRCNAFVAAFEHALLLDTDVLFAYVNRRRGDDA